MAEMEARGPAAEGRQVCSPRHSHMAPACNMTGPGCPSTCPASPRTVEPWKSLGGCCLNCSLYSCTWLGTRSHFAADSENDRASPGARHSTSQKDTARAALSRLALRQLSWACGQQFSSACPWLGACRNAVGSPGLLNSGHGEKLRVM